MNVDREELKMWIEDLKCGIQGVHERLDTLNGRTRRSEMDIAVLQDRSELSNKRASRAAYAGTGAGASLIAAFELFKWWRS